MSLRVSLRAVMVVPRLFLEEISDACRELERLGAGELLCIARDLDGTMEGYSLPLIDLASSSVNIPVIACGGCGTPEHMMDAFDMGANVVAAGSMFLYTDHTPKSCAEFLKKRGYNVRT